MSNLINLENVAKSYGVRPILDGISLGVARGDRIGVVGINGGGKSTLINVLAGVETPDSGRVSHLGDLQLAVVTQQTQLAGTTVRECVVGAMADHEWAGDRHIRDVVDGLGLTIDASVATMSGGERRRVALAAALVQELDLIVLDEPTNHLDIEGVQWLAQHLQSRSSALVIVTHDRWFLDTVCNRTWEVADGQVFQFDGGYGDWIFARAQRQEQADSTERKRRNLARKELAWLRRGPPARTSKPRYRIEAAEALIADVPAPRESVELVSFAKRRLGNTVIELENVDITAGDRVLAADVTWRLAPGERVGLLGANGSGKTSLLRRLAEPGPGRKEGKTVHLAWLTQELIDLPNEMRVLEAIEDIAGRVTVGKREVSASQLAEIVGFGPNRQWTPVGDLSGGERRRLQLARLLMDEPNVLLLDEPTNDLDIDTLQQLEDLLDAWPGTLVVVSHDRYLIDRVCDRTMALLGDGRLTEVIGGTEEYLSRRATQSSTAPRNASTGPSDAAQDRVVRKELASLGRRLKTLDAKEAKLHQALADAATDPDRLLTLGAELKQLIAERETLEDRWLELSV